MPPATHFCITLQLGNPHQAQKPIIPFKIIHCCFQLGSSKRIKKQSETTAMNTQAKAKLYHDTQDTCYKRALHILLATFNDCCMLTTEPLVLL